MKSALQITKEDFVPEIHKTSLRRQVTNFDDLPMIDRSLIDYEVYNRSIGMAKVKNCITLQATRGCPYNCAFCFSIWPKKHVFRSALHIFTEIKQYYDIGVRRFTFVDDIFNLNVKNSTRFFQLIIKHKLDLQLFFAAGIRGDILTKEYIDLMVEAGTVNMALALETASPRLQTLIQKNLDLEKLKENIDYICKKHPQVILDLFAIYGFPGETEEEALLTLNFISSLKWLHFPYIYYLKIFPKTGMEQIALKSGISLEAILKSVNRAYHELPDTLPFSKDFAIRFKTRFLDEYFLSRERLLHVLPYQIKVLTEDELVQKYNNYLPVVSNRFHDFLQFFGIKEDELGTEDYIPEDHYWVPRLNEKLEKLVPGKEPLDNALRIVLLDLSQSFRDQGSLLDDLNAQPLGLMSLLTYLNRRQGNKIHGRIAKSRIDFNSYHELKVLLNEFEPQMIGIRTLTFYKNFMHKTIAMIRQWGIDVPVIVGGPYATSDCEANLQDSNIDLVVLGEGEITFNHLVEKIIENGGDLPGEQILKDIPGIAFVPGRIDPVRDGSRGQELQYKQKQEMLALFNQDLEDE